MSQSSGGGNASSRTKTLAESWSMISNEYERVLVPRFASWTRDALDALRVAVNEGVARCSPGNDSTPPRALVLCCGPGHELMPVAKILGSASATPPRVIGSDLAPGMINVARERLEAECRMDDGMYRGCITAEVGDAMDPPPGPHHVIFSAFGLQQLPSPIRAIESWFNVMEPGGVCVFVYWPPNPPKIPGDDKDDPWKLWGELLKRKLGKKDEGKPWDENIDAAVAAAGGEIVHDKFITHDICWSCVRDMFDGMSRAGPWHAMRLRRGDDFVDELGKELQSMLHTQYPIGKTLSHKTTARMIVARRQKW